MPVILTLTLTLTLTLSPMQLRLGESTSECKESIECWQFLARLYFQQPLRAFDFQEQRCQSLKVEVSCRRCPSLKVEVSCLNTVAQKPG